jgi:hypothetical protein
MSSQFMPIPEDFYSFDTNKPFEACLVCKADLLGGQVDYFIEKAIKNYPGHDVSDVVYEYAICSHCAQDMNEKMSAASMRNLQAYFSGNETFMAKINHYNNNWQELEGSPLSETCAMTGVHKAELEEYMIYGHFKGGQMIKSTMPFLLSGKVMDDVADLLSEETIDELDDFMGEYFGGPPELEELWKPRRPVFF